MTLSQKALEVALTQLGVHEEPKGSNSGPQVNQYLKSIGLGPGFSWCMAFVYWCHNEAAKLMGITNTMVKTGGVMEQWNKRKAHFSKNIPQPGDTYIMDYGGGLGHTGIVLKVIDDRTIEGIEGNTNDEGGREGYEVCKRIRLRSKIKGYLRF